MHTKLRRVLLTCRRLTIDDLTDNCNRELHAALDTAGSYKPSVDIWALGAIVLYAMAPHTDIQSFKTMTQDNVDALLNLEFKELPISEAGQDFVRRCLKIDPNARMSISESRNHQWLKVEKHDHKEWTRIRDSLWRTSHAISPPVEPLPDVLGHIQQQSQSQVPGQAARFTSTRSKLKRHIEETELSVTPNDSPFFATSKTARTTSDSTFQQTTLAIDAGILDTGL